jgi:molybdopterin synthase catalytic subunit
MIVRLTRETIDLLDLVGRVRSPEAGAICTFQGPVRAERPENPLLALEYSAYEEMALREMEKVRSEAMRRFPVTEVAIVHRLGRLEIGEVSVAIVVSAPHREAAFAACRYAIDELKQSVPIWKKEIWTTGETTWVDPTAEESDGAGSR